MAPPTYEGAALAAVIVFPTLQAPKPRVRSAPHSRGHSLQLVQSIVKCLFSSIFLSPYLTFSYNSQKAVVFLPKSYMIELIVMILLYYHLPIIIYHGGAIMYFDAHFIFNTFRSRWGFYVCCFVL